MLDPQLGSAFVHEIHVGIACTTTEKLTLSTQLTNGHLNGLLNGRDGFKFFLTWPTGE